MCADPQQYDLVIHAKNIVTMDEHRRVLRDGYIGIKNSIIAYVGEQKINGQETIQAPNAIAIPGLINTHTHIAMTLMRGLSDDQSFVQGWEKYIFPAEAKFVSDEFVYLGSQLGIMEMLASGTTTFCDMYFHSNQVARASNQAGVRACVAGDLTLPHLQDISADERLQRGKALFVNYVEEYKKYDRVKPMIGPHAPYSASKSQLQEILEIAKKHQTPISIHVAEHQNEKEMIKNAFGYDVSSVVSYLDDFGFFDHQVICAHMVWPTENDIDILAQKNVSIAHCPQSNLKLGSGIAPIAKMLDKGIVVSVATDGPASNNNLNLWEEMALAALLHKGTNHDPTVISAQKALEMVTIDAAKALWMDDQIGSIEVGKKADIALVNTDVVHQMPPSENIYSQLVYSAQASDIQTVLCDGKVLLDHGHYTTLDTSELFQKALTVRKKIDTFILQVS